jgi:hypothetical protein
VAPGVGWHNRLPPAHRAWWQPGLANGRCALAGCCRPPQGPGGSQAQAHRAWRGTACEKGAGARISNMQLHTQQHAVRTQQDCMGPGSGRSHVTRSPRAATWSAPGSGSSRRCRPMTRACRCPSGEPGRPERRAGGRRAGVWLQKGRTSAAAGGRERVGPGVPASVGCKGGAGHPAGRGQQQQQRRGRSHRGARGQAAAAGHGRDWGASFAAGGRGRGNWHGQALTQ